jgi:hypothetical protein
LRHCATPRKVAGSIPDRVNGIPAAKWHWGRLTEMSKRNISRDYSWVVRRAENLNTFMGRLSRNPGASPSWNIQGLGRDRFNFVIYITNELREGQNATDTPKHNFLYTPLRNYISNFIYFVAWPRSV